jgi:hypothetical protein
LIEDIPPQFLSEIIVRDPFDFLCLLVVEIDSLVELAIDYRAAELAQENHGL